jgi:hypothetical protein
VQALMLREARLQELLLPQPGSISGRIVRKFEEIGAAYSTTCSTEMHCKMYHIMYGQFRNKKGWAQGLEDLYMKENKWEYIENEAGFKGVKGFVEMHIMEQYNEQTKAIRRRCMKTHGQFVRLRAENGTKETAENDEAGIDDDDYEIENGATNEVQASKTTRENKKINKTKYNESFICMVQAPVSSITLNQHESLPPINEQLEKCMEKISALEEENKRLRLQLGIDADEEFEESSNQSAPVVSPKKCSATAAYRQQKHSAPREEDYAPLSDVGSPSEKSSPVHTFKLDGNTYNSYSAFCRAKRLRNQVAVEKVTAVKPVMTKPHPK